MTAKLRIKAKGIEIEWEGEVDYLKNDLPGLIAAIVEALGINAGEDDSDELGDVEAIFVKPGKTFTTAALAAKLKPSSGADLFKVALAKLQFSDKIEPASRAQIHAEMKVAPKYYKPTMFGNLGKAITKLLEQGAINEPSEGNFALTEEAQQEIQSKM